ncbi:MAG: hypothetical protein HYZ49_01490 [Chloroflexi bacterium]|nr:hypothetical protein [Chloroflexota bacterium]
MDFVRSNIWAFQIISGVLWTLAYILIIKRGFQDRTFGMPLPALAANISWEFLFSFIRPHPTPQLYVNIVWFLFDVVILFQAFRFGKAVFEGGLPKRLFYPALALTLVIGFGLVAAISSEFNDWEGKYAAFGQNLMMSVLFVSMLFQRNNVGGQSLYIAVFKMAGTLVPSVLFFAFVPSSPLLNFLYVSIFIFDLIYVLALYQKLAGSGINPWARF